MKAKTQTFNPEAEAVLQYVPDFQTSTFTVTGLGEQLEPLAEEIKAMEAAAPIVPVAANKVPVARVQPKDEYIDFSTLEGKELVRRKISAWVYDRRNGTNMLDLLNQRIEDDRNVAMATKLGIISTVYCQKHQKAVDKLKHLV